MGELNASSSPLPCKPQEGARCTHGDFLFLRGLARRYIALASLGSVLCRVEWRYASRASLAVEERLQAWLTRFIR